MLTHVTLGYNDRHRSEHFYRAVMPALGLKRVKQTEKFFAYARSEDETPWIFLFQPFDGLPATWGNGFHLALLAKDENQVETFHRQALAAGGIDEGGPGIRDRYADDYFGAYVRDPDGNKLQAVFYRKGRKAGPGGTTISHITLGTHDLEAAVTFYEALMAPLGLARLPAEESPGEDTAFGRAGTRMPILFIQYPFDGRPASWGNGTHVSFEAPSRKAVDVFHAIALEQGGTSDGAPGLRPELGPAYYAAYVRDKTGNKLQAVCLTPAD
ncbi:MAG: VOC family protein [Geminicoccaceae bacterium]